MTENEEKNPSFGRMNRLDFDTSMMIAASAISHMATCRRRNVGCILTYNKFIVATGFNGAPSGFEDCLENGCLLNDMGHCINCIHAEANAVMRCKIADTAYCTDQPCVNCLKLLIQKGVNRIFYLRSYNDRDTTMFLEKHYGDSINWPLLALPNRQDMIVNHIDSSIKEWLI